LGQVAVTVHGRSYPIACDDGQEEHVVRLASYLDKRASELERTVGLVSEARMLVMISLLVADELAEAHDELRRAREALVSAEGAARKAGAEAVERRVSPMIERLAVRLDDIAARLEAD
jgi:cell division protein ZapA